jgi:hypothetical protein
MAWRRRQKGHFYLIAAVQANTTKAGFASQCLLGQHESI